MKVCIIGLRGLPNIAGGIETHCENLFENLARDRSDLDIMVYGRTPYIGKAPYMTDAGIKVIPVFAAQNKYLETITNTFVAILHARFRSKADCIHIHAIGPGLLAPFARLLGVPVVLTHHGDDFRRAKWNRFASAVLRFGERLGIKSATQTIAVSPTLAERLRSDYPDRADRIHYIPNGADHIVARSKGADGTTVLDRFNLKQGAYFVTVGRLVPEKGFADLIRAHKMANATTPLVIVGGHSNSDHDHELSALAHDSVTMTGSLPQAEVAQLLANARLFVLPSHHEGLPIAALEAWAMGAPLLLSDIQPNRDLGLPQDHYFPVGNLDSLAEKLGDDAPRIPALPLAPAFNWSLIATETGQVYDLFHNEPSSLQTQG
ncbi:glycosyltransferase family 4 protein [Roseobacter sp. CCS2]|uniref:glycosyltransferase family 4 protein n=1 Tax=Roseobacter sp. CCS2 TaxID=391593 RepID=UPI0000F401B1|nr:glycosyltransferase family 4 protein [Roseobacter sp. CCS2]EBA13094.1 glycosyl transferase, group 1 [Roseobacter sp. CCS2]